MRREVRLRYTVASDWMLMAGKSNYQARDLARHFQVSCRQLRRQSLLLFGQSPQAWLDYQRMIAAGYCLLRSHCVKTAAYELGFRQVSHFCRRFKLVYGMTPSEFLGMASDLRRAGCETGEDRWSRS